MKAIVAVLASVTVMTALTTACSSAPPKDPPELSDDQRPPNRTRSHEEDETLLEGSPIEAAPSASGSGAAASCTPPASFHGTSPTTNTFGFGGDPYACNWNITMKALVLDVSADATSGAVKSATFRARAVEETLPPCDAAPYPPNDHLYTLTSASLVAPGITRLTLAPKSTNLPQAAATIDVDLSKAPVTASVRIHRTDQSAPLDWTVLAKVTLE